MTKDQSGRLRHWWGIRQYSSFRRRRPMPDPLTLNDLVKQALAATEPAARLRLVAELARATRDAEQMTAAADLFLAAGPDARRAALEWLARLRGPLPAALVARVLPLLSARQVPPSVRVAAAARLLRAVPDRI